MKAAIGADGLQASEPPPLDARSREVDHGRLRRGLQPRYAPPGQVNDHDLDRLDRALRAERIHDLLSPGTARTGDERGGKLKRQRSVPFLGPGATYAGER
jgi:hypothetical protein